MQPVLPPASLSTQVHPLQEGGRVTEVIPMRAVRIA
jgi:hypothetical protein